MQINIDRIAASLAGLILPSECRSCGSSADSFKSSPVCAACWSAITQYNGPKCSVCARPLNSIHSITCAGCLLKPPPFKKAFYYGFYMGPLREAIKAMKFNHIKRLSRPLSGLLCSIDLPKADAVIPVPSGPMALRLRGFNQSALIAKNIARHLDVPFIDGVLYKKHDTAFQVGLGWAERKKNLKAAFATRKSLKAVDRVLLVDDVITTGATMSECARMLLKSGVAEVYAVSVARAGMIISTGMLTEPISPRL